ncbi:Tex family protein [Parahaliea mediterranea]|uniref:RNA-binding transcriptional accessory protein n=1 Tax=Parahaliea mediterranea TaxID=651086 RepID=A0A939DD03_9GAMM|nr:Tex family protein [Parahaliea mediterranea]MBN7795656.1 RNA-binding transcriptional accessory protein [Parahaliea mediterranea]
MTTAISQRLADELAVREAQINAAVSLLDEGATVPFIARYRKEVTGGLDDSQMRQLEERLHYLRDMEERRQTILKSIDEQGKLTPELEQSILSAETKNRLEDLYLPYKPKRRTKAQIAREAGLEPLADALLADPGLEPEATAQAYLNEDAGIGDTKAALDGARQILMERFAEDADLLARVRDFLADNVQLASRLVEGKEQEAAKFRDYFEHTEALAGVPSHRALAMFRGRNEGFLHLSLVMHAEEKPTDAHPCEAMIAEHWQIADRGRAADRWLQDTVRWAWRVKLLTHLQTDLLGQLRERAEAEAIDVFANNLKDLLLAAPAGAKATIGLDPGLRTGVKVAVVDANGKLLDHTAIFPTPPQNRTREAAATLVQMIRKHGVELIAIGNGTASRETDKFVGDMLRDNPDLKASKVMVNESGASIYSASEFAAREFPDLDVTIRGAVSIARRLQDPLAELVKIDPKSIGVGQYQHDVSQVQLARQLDAVVEDCVNAVGVDVNTASVPLLSRVSGLNQTLAGNIVALRDETGSFANRRALLKVARFGDKTFELAAGFLRINGGDNPLDASAVHPESYAVVEDIARRQQREVASLVGDSRFLRALKPQDYTSDTVGLPTVTDIIAELDKPGRDPRPEFRMATFQEGVEKISDLRPDMVLEGTVTNVTNFGAFVDIGVHQDGLVHISALADRFVKDPRDVVKAGDIVKVKVMEVDEARKRIGLSMRLGDKAADQASSTRGETRRGGRDRRGGAGKKAGQDKPAANTALAAAFANARQGR